MSGLFENKCMSCMSGYYDLRSDKCPICLSSRSISNQDHQLIIGSVVGGRFLIGRALGQGGFGITYIGWDMKENRKVAVKEYFPNGCATRKKDNYTLTPYIDADSIGIYNAGKKRFISEAECLRSLNYIPNIVKVRSCFSENDTAYIVMDYVDGITLKQYLKDRGGRTTMDDILLKLRPVFKSLYMIHSRNLIHRDISPDNIILSPAGAVLLDFGSARPFSFGNDMTKTINVKVGYAPPEQYDSHGYQGPWTDIFALSATIYRAVTGKLPQSALERSESRDTLVKPSLLNPMVTAGEEQVLLKGLALDPANRYYDIRSFYKDLTDAKNIQYVQPVVSTPAYDKIPDKKAGEKNANIRRRLINLAMGIIFSVLALYTAVFFIYSYIQNNVVNYLAVQQILVPISFGIAAGWFIYAYIRDKKVRCTVLIIINWAVLFICLLSSGIYLIYSDWSGNSISTDSILNMVISMHLAAEIIAFVLLIITEKMNGKRKAKRIT